MEKSMYEGREKRRLRGAPWAVRDLPGSDCTSARFRRSCKLNTNSDALSMIKRLLHTEPQQNRECISTSPGKHVSSGCSIGCSPGKATLHLLYPCFFPLMTYQEGFPSISIHHTEITPPSVAVLSG